MSAAARRLPIHDSTHEPTRDDLIRHLKRLEAVKLSLQAHWCVQSTRPLVRALDTLRESIFKAVEMSECIAEELVTHPKAAGYLDDREFAHVPPSEGERAMHLDWDLREGL